MIFYRLLCNIIFIPFIFCGNMTVDKIDTSKKTLSDIPQEKLFNGTKVVSEGGSILPETLLMALPKGNSSQETFGNVIGKNKIVPRKGAIYENTTKPQDINLSAENSSTQTSTSGDTLKTLNQETKNETIGKGTLLQPSLNDSKVNKAETPKKPLILNSDALENMTVKSSLGTSVNSQLQSQDNKVRSYLPNANNHPGMVMPIVITILLVPMFAVLGYMALRRGQEAWKNRHYKRMDFLLDGMYND